MSVFEKFYENRNEFSRKTDFSLVRVDDNLLIGEDQNGNISLVIISKESQRDSLAQKTKELSFECNIKISYSEKNEVKKDICHIIRCYSKLERDRDVFLKLCDTFFSNQKVTMDLIIEIFGVMNNFFTKKKKYSKEMLQGLYAELYTIYYFRDKFDFSKSWQNKDRMKFDFSINETVKLEVKSTSSSSRIHHFKHEQLATNIVDIYILSYKLREDNDGLSLLDLMNNTIPLLDKYPRKQSRLLKIIYDCDGEDILSDLKYLENYTIANMKFFDAKDVPKFDGNTPANVSDAEYNSNCENIQFLEENEMLEFFNKSIEL